MDASTPERAHQLLAKPAHNIQNGYNKYMVAINGMKYSNHLHACHRALTEIACCATGFACNVATGVACNMAIFRDAT